jgi:DNA-binding XRE family transcriptional regulator
VSKAARQLPKSKHGLPNNELDLAAIRQDGAQIMRAVVSVLRGARQDAGITQRQMGYWLDLSEDAVSNIEALKTPITFPKAILWAILCKVDLAEFFELFQIAMRKRKLRKA